MTRCTGTRRTDDGSVLVLAMMAMTTVLLLAALVLDVGVLKISAREAQSTADLSALAGGLNLGAGDSVHACTDIVNYLNTNTPDMSPINATGFCAQPGNDVSATVCDPPNTATQAAPTIISGRYTVTIHHREAMKLLSQGDVEEIIPGLYAQVSDWLYDKNLGLLLDGQPPDAKACVA